MWQHTDATGSVQAETNSAGVVVERDTALPYRDPLTSTLGPDGTSADEDDEVLVYIHARYYDPVIGRFLSPDPSPDPTRSAGLNPYAYDSDDPVNRVDPSGAGDVEGDDAPLAQNPYSRARGWRSAAGGGSPGRERPVHAGVAHGSPEHGGDRDQRERHLRIPRERPAGVRPAVQQRHLSQRRPPHADPFR